VAGSKEKVAFEITGDDKSGRAFSSAEQRLRGVEAAVADVSKKVLAMGAAVAAAEAVVLASVIKTSAEFERYATQLETIEGSSAKAARSMDWITDFTAKTPFELDQVTASFVKLKAYGIDPIANDALTTLGDTAAAMGKSLNQSVEALADAATGEFERLKEFGIKARVEGDKVAFAYSQNGEQMVQSADRNSQEMIRHTLLGIWNDKYAGGMDKLSKTWEGMTSNLSDNWTIFKKNIGDGGVFEAAKGSLGVVLDELNKNDEAVKLLARDISDGLVSSLEVGTMSAGIMAKGFATLPVVFNAVRVGVDSVALAGVQGFDMMLAAAETYMEVVQHIPGIIGDDAKNDLATIREMRREIAHLEEGIKATGNESLDTFLDSTVEAESSWAGIDDKVVKVLAALDKGRNAPANVSAAANDDEGTGGGGPSGAAAAAAQVEADSVISIHQAKFERMAAIAAEADMADDERAISKLSRDLDEMEAEKDRIMEMDAFKASSKEQQLAFEDEVDAAMIARGWQTEAELAAIDEARVQSATDAEARKNAIVGGLQATAFNQGVAFLQLFAGKSKEVALLLIAIQTAKAVSDISIQAASATAQITAYGNIEAAAHSAMFNYPAAAAALGKMTAQIAAVNTAAALGMGFAVAGGIAQGAAAMKGGGSQATPTYNVNPGTGLPSPSAQPTGAPQQQPQTVIHKTVYIQGNVLTKEFARSDILPEIYDADESGEVLVVSPRGRTAAEIRDQT
jgi:hypothetical protein